MASGSDRGVPIYPSTPRRSRTGSELHHLTPKKIETTALVLDVLASPKQQGQSSVELDRALDRGTLFLLKNKDEYGVWYSTQATVDVLQTLIRQLEGGSPDASRAPLRIFVDGKPGPAFSTSSDARQLTPQRADLTPFLSPGKHLIELHGGGSAHASAYVNASYYVPWTDPAVSGSSVPSGDAESLHYSVKFDHAATSVGDLIQCTVHAERVGFRGYGMMLAEVGLPPGADVDRASPLPVRSCRATRFSLIVWSSTCGREQAARLSPLPSSPDSR